MSLKRDKSRPFIRQALYGDEGGLRRALTKRVEQWEEFHDVNFFREDSRCGGTEVRALEGIVS